MTFTKLWSWLKKAGDQAVALTPSRHETHSPTCACGRCLKEQFERALAHGNDASEFTGGDFNTWARTGKGDW